MGKSALTQTTLSMHWFLKAPKHEPVAQMKPVLSKSSEIITLCQEILALTDDQYCKERFHQIIRNVTILMPLVDELDENDSEDFLAKLQNACSELNREVLTVPAEIHTPTDFAAVNYRIALTCFFIIILSVSLAVGATYGAWYFGYLAAGYFTDMLALAFSSIGVPALCLGLFSEGVYMLQKNPVDEMFEDVKVQVNELCDCIFNLMESEVESETLEAHSPSRA